jgi:glycine betaine/proline transport system ATP-binding protein
MSQAPERVVAKNVYKIFGEAHEAEAIRKLESGASKDDVYRETGSVVAVRDVSFKVYQGQIFVVMGLSGSGKSTLIRCINRLIDPTRGQILLDGNDIMALDREQLRQIRLKKMAMVFQHFALFPHKTVGENVEYGLKIQGAAAAARRKKALEALGMVGLRDWADTPPENLSGGMQQRVGLARALAVDPELMLMDEPFSALDPLIRSDMQKELIRLQHKLKMTIVFITHDLHEALTLGDQIAIMKAGAFVQVGPPEEIVANPADEYVADFTKDVDRGRVFTVRRVMHAAEALSLDGSSAAAARTRLGELERDALYVTDAEGKPVGLVTERDLGKADSQELGSVMHTRFPSTAPDAVLYDCFEACGSGLPVAVVGEDGRLQGVLEPRDVFRALRVGGDEAESTDTAAPAGRRPADAQVQQA